MRRVFIDAGHGGLDSGAVAPTGVQEKEVTLDVALKLKQYLSRHDVDVALSRETDIAVSLADRSEMANRWDADVFVSVHSNSAEEETSQGIETWIPGPGHGYRRFGPSMTLGFMIQAYLIVNTARRDRGVKFTENLSKEFYVLRSTRMPACLLELAFLSNPQEASFLGTQWFMQKASLGVTSAILKFLEIPS